MYAYRVSAPSATLFAEPCVAISFAAGVTRDCDDWLACNLWCLVKTLESEGEVTLKGDAGTCTVTRLQVEDD